jgi:hypothetical protein
MYNEGEDVRNIYRINSNFTFDKKILISLEDNRKPELNKQDVDKPKL